MDEKNFLKDVGKRIRDERIRLDLSQEQLAERMGKTQNTISAYETGLHAMRIVELPLFADALGVSMSQLLGEEFFSKDEIFMSSNKHLESLINKLDENLKRSLIRDIEELIELQTHPYASSLLIKRLRSISINEHKKALKNKNLQEREKDPQRIAYDLFLDARAVFEGVDQRMIREKTSILDFINMMENYGYRFSKKEFSIKTFATLVRVDIEPLWDILRHLGYKVEG